ncbi:MAG: nuclear transport factor 2 family protein, partial [Candidatus Sulfotelmatobacter sp.]
RRKMLVENDEQQIVTLFEDGDRALIAADLAELSRIFADDYVQYDETGRQSTKEDVLNKLKFGALRYVSMISTGRHIRLLGKNMALVHGSEEDEVEQAGKRRSIRYIYMDAVMKRNGKWQIVASQLARALEFTDLPSGRKH